MLIAAKSGDIQDGIKGVSCLAAFQHFNIIHSMSGEYMHCCLLGVTKQLLKKFLESKNSGKAFYISPKNRKILNQRILNLKPPAYVVRKPRSLDDLPNFKASEFRFFLLYYLPVCLNGLIPNKYIQHVRRLSAAVYILLQSSIPKKQVNESEKLLHQFVKDHQQFFGKESMVLNVHLLKHLAQSVRKLGPLWCHSAFAFERNNGVLLKMVNGTTDVLLQIGSKYALSKSVVKAVKQTKSKVLLGSGIKLTEKSLHVLDVESNDELDWSNVTLSVHTRIQLGKTTYTSLMYTRPKKSIDYCIELKNGNIGMARFFVEHNKQICVVMDQYEIIDYLDHIMKIQSISQTIVVNISDISCKLVYMKVGPNQYVCKAPNPYEIE